MNGCVAASASIGASDLGKGAVPAGCRPRRASARETMRMDAWGDKSAGQEESLPDVVNQGTSRFRGATPMFGKSSKVALLQKVPLFRDLSHKQLSGSPGSPMNWTSPRANGWRPPARPGRNSS